MLLYSLFAKEALESFSSKHRREIYERIGLRVTAYADREPEIELRLDPAVLPSVPEAEAAYTAAIGNLSAEDLEDLARRLLLTEGPQILDEETGEWVPADAEDYEPDFEPREYVPDESTPS